MVSFVKTNVHDDLNETERIVSFDPFIHIEFQTW